MSANASASTAKPMNMGLQLFPPAPKKTNNPPGKPSTNRSAVSPQSPPQSAAERAESPSFLDGRQSAMDGRASAMGGRSTPQNGRQTPQSDRARATPSPITVPPPVHSVGDLPPRSHTSFSEAPTLVRSTSNSSHRSVPKSTPNTSPPRSEPIMRSIFPRYNPDVPLEHQPYYPTQTSPKHIPKNIINRRPYSPTINEERDRMVLGLQSPPPVGISPGRFPRGLQEETILEPSSNDEMRELWKVTNGWRVSASEGRSFCLKVTSSPEEPVYTLSSTTQAFYTLRLDPTSTSAQMTLTRQDPSKTPKESSSKIGSSKPNTGMEVLSTTLEEPVRRLPPNDGLIALLYPRAASNMVIEMANKPNRADQESIQEAAERECARLVWDEDSKRYYLVHPAVATPFHVCIHATPAWSRIEYTLEHAELPRNLVRLVRDGAGSGFLEIDTAVAAKIDCFYIVDVVICALMLVAIEEEKGRDVERFEAPPSLAPISPKSTTSKKWTRQSKAEKESKIEEFEMDLESQMSIQEKKQKEKGHEKVPGFFGLLWMLIKFMVWVVAFSFKALAKIIIFISTCLTRKS